MRPRTISGAGRDLLGVDEVPRRRVVEREADNSQSAVLQELGLTLAGFLVVFLAAIWLARALGAG